MGSAVQVLLKLLELLEPLEAIKRRWRGKPALHLVGK